MHQHRNMGTVGLKTVNPVGFPDQNSRDQLIYEYDRSNLESDVRFKGGRPKAIVADEGVVETLPDQTASAIHRYLAFPEQEPEKEPPAKEKTKKEPASNKATPQAGKNKIEQPSKGASRDKGSKGKKPVVRVEGVDGVPASQGPPSKGIGIMTITLI